MRTIIEIKKIFTTIDLDKIPTVIKEFENDDRKGVQSILKTYSKKYNDYLNELNRIEQLCNYDKVYYTKEIEFVAGIDEVGRGPLAGPVVAAAVILPKNCKIMYIDDSKKLSAIKREKLFNEITQEAIDIGIGIVPNSVIDDINILQATFEAMRIAINNLKIKPNYIIVDGNKTIPDIRIEQECIVKGDQKSMLIAAASIIAKVTRDRMMKLYNEVYPQYLFDKNSGYGSEAHIKAIRENGLTPIHRRTFTKNL